MRPTKFVALSAINPCFAKPIVTVKSATTQSRSALPESLSSPVGTSTAKINACASRRRRFISRQAARNGSRKGGCRAKTKQAIENNDTGGTCFRQVLFRVDAIPSANCAVFCASIRRNPFPQTRAAFRFANLHARDVPRRPARRQRCCPCRRKRRIGPPLEKIAKPRVQCPRPPDPSVLPP